MANTTTTAAASSEPLRIPQAVAAVAGVVAAVAVAGDVLVAADAGGVAAAAVADLVPEVVDILLFCYFCFLK